MSDFKLVRESDPIIRKNLVAEGIRLSDDIIVKLQRITVLKECMHSDTISPSELEELRGLLEDVGWFVYYEWF